MVSISAARRQELEARLRAAMAERLRDREICARLGVSKDWVERARKRLGIPRIPQSERVAGSNNPAYRGGARVLVAGYWYVYAPNHPNRTKQNRMAEHRLVMEAKLGRLLERREVVHHMNGDRKDNRPENLGVFSSNTDHLRHELTGRVPNWTPEGWARMQEGTQRAARNRRAKANERRRLRSIARSEDIDGNSGAGPAS